MLSPHDIDLDARIASQLSLPPAQVAAARTLLDGGATVPFVARYRKERTGGLDEVQIRDIARLQQQIVELEERRGSIRETLRELGKLSPELERALDACDTRGDLEDLYAPYKKRRKTRADTAREQGLEPLAQRILAQPTAGDPDVEARRFVSADKGVADTAAALAGASDIVAETLAADPVHVAGVRRVMREQGVVSTTIRKGAEGADRFRDYADHHEPIGRIPSHRYLAICRGEAEDVLSVKVRPDVHRTLQMFLRSLKWFPKSPFGPILERAAEDALKRLLLPAAERSVRAEHKAAADDEAIDVSSGTSRRCCCRLRSGRGRCSVSTRGSAPGASVRWCRRPAP